jgi:hypothetical protein
MASIYRELGDYLFRSDVPQSIRAYSRAVLYNPLSVPNTYMFVRALATPLLNKMTRENRNGAAGPA